jgi:hypothetical protein
MARDRTISSDFWTWHAVIGCPAMTRLLFIGLWNFADSFGVQPLLPGTIRMRIFPGDPLDDQQVRAMIEELIARKLVYVYEAEGQEYLAVVDWARHHRVGKRAKRRWPADPALPVPPPPVPPLPVPPGPVAEAASVTPPAPRTEEASSGVPGVSPVVAQWRKSVGRALGHFLPGGAPPDVEAWIDRWIADGCDLRCDVLPAISLACRPSPYGEPPAGLAAVGAYAEANRLRRLAVAHDSLAA